MASSPITSWQIDGEKVETETDFISLGSKITVDGDCSHEIKSGQGTVGCSGRRLKQAEPEQRAEGCSQGKSSNTLGLSRSQPTGLPAPLPSPPPPQGLINSVFPGHQELLSLLTSHHRNHLSPMHLPISGSRKGLPPLQSQALILKTRLPLSEGSNNNSSHLWEVSNPTHCFTLNWAPPQPHAHLQSFPVLKTPALLTAAQFPSISSHQEHLPRFHNCCHNLFPEVLTLE